LQKQVEQTKKVAELTGKTFISSTRRFSELEDIQQKQEVSLSGLAELSVRGKKNEIELTSSNFFLDLSFKFKIKESLSFIFR